VPGVILSNRPLIIKQPDLTDLAAAIVTYFDIEKPAQFEGQPAF